MSSPYYCVVTGDAASAGDRAPVRGAADAASAGLPLVAGAGGDARAALGGRLEAQGLPRTLQRVQGRRPGGTSLS